MTTPSLTHVELIASLSDAERQNLVGKSDGAGLLRIGSHLVLIFISGLWIATGMPFWQWVMLVHGIMLSFLFAAEHESIHGTAFNTYSFNVWTARFAGFVLLLPPMWFRYFHFAHHRHTNDRTKDPELASPRPSTILQYISHVSGIPYWIAQIKTMIGNAIGIPEEGFVPERGKTRVRNEARVFLSLYFAIALGSFLYESALLLYIWIIPVLLGQPFLRMALLAEHLFCPDESNMLRNSRTTFTNWPVRWITWNMAFHAEHHSYPAVPFHKLPEFHAYTRVHTRNQQNGYANFHADTVSKLVTKVM